MDNQYNYYNPNENCHHDSTTDFRTPQNFDQKKKKHRGAALVAGTVGLAVLFGVTASVVFMGSNILGSSILGMGRSADKASVSSEKTGNGTSLSTSTSVVTSDVSEVVDKVMPSIVSITSMSVEEVQNFFGNTYQEAECRGRNRNYYWRE